MAAVRVSSRPSFLVLSSCLYYCFLMPAIHFRRASSLSFNFTFTPPQSPNIRGLINCTGDATIDGESLWLTRSRYNQETTSSAGWAQYVEAVPLWDRASGEMASFTTTFHFNITPVGGSSGGDGMAFFLAPPESGVPVNVTNSGGALGLLPNFPKYWNDTAGIIAVEFDTFQNLDYADISDDHIGIDVNSLISTASTNITSQNNNLPENVAVGFSAATGSYSELHQILSWSFTSTLQVKPPAPEFVNTAHPSIYSDVYSFGIVLLEIVSGRCPVILLEGGAHFILVKWMWGLYGRNTKLQIPKSPNR